MAKKKKGEDVSSPLFASDKAVADSGGLGKSNGLSSHTSSSDFPIKKIAFRSPAAAADDIDAGVNDIDGKAKSAEVEDVASDDDGVSDAEKEYKKREEEREWQQMMVEAKAAADEAVRRVYAGYIPGELRETEDGGVEYTPVKGCLGYQLTQQALARDEAENNKGKKKKKGKGVKKKDGIDSSSEFFDPTRMFQPKKVKISRDGTIPTQDFGDTNYPTYGEGDDDSTSFFDPKRMFKQKQRKKKGKAQDAKPAGDVNHPGQQSKNQHGTFGEEEEKEEINEDDDGDLSLPRTYDETRTATTTPTEFDSTTYASGNTEPKKMFKQKQQKPKRSKKKKKRGMKDMTPDEEAMEEAKVLVEAGAWICGVCGTPYDTQQHAKDHEKVCLIEWLKHDKLAMQAAKDEGRPKNTTGVPIMFLPEHYPEVKSTIQNYPEYLPPRTVGEIPLSSDLVRKYILINDQATASVMNRLQWILHERCDKDLCELSLKKGMARRSPGKAEEYYSELDGKMHEDLFICERGYDAMRELELASKDRHWYAYLEQRAMERRYGVNPNLTHHDYYYHRLNRTLAAGSGKFDMPPPEDKDDENNEAHEEAKKKFHVQAKAWGAVKGRFDNAYKLVKEGPANIDGGKKRQVQKEDKNSNTIKRGDMEHDSNTLYINVVVKNSVQVVNNELRRIAKGWWKSELSKKGEEEADEKEDILDFQFEWIRAHTQKRVIQLAGMALASDFTPRKVAGQLSKDLYRLMEPQLKPRGVTIQTIIEYREGQYFVLAVNILKIDWILLMKWVAVQWQNNPTLALGQSRSILNIPKRKTKKNMNLNDRVKAFLAVMRQRFPSRNEVIAYFLYSAYRLHVLFAVPLLSICYAFFFRYAINKFILNAVTDDIFQYVEEKGMEMQLGIKNNNAQASFMLAALREIRSGEKKGKIEEGEEDEDVRPIIGPLMGPAVKDDGGDATIPADFAPPDVLEFIAFETDLPVGFLRLRWALLHAESSFLKDAFFTDVMKYDKVEIGEWSSNGSEIGLPKPPEGVDESSFLNATLEFSYLMPKSAFVKANMCYATFELIHYDSYCLVIKEKTLTPEAPYGNTFIAWTQYSIVNTGKNTCQMVCSVEAEFPNGQPMVARQIKSGMRSGTAEKFVSLGETVCRYADAYP